MGVRAGHRHGIKSWLRRLAQASPPVVTLAAMCTTSVPSAAQSAPPPDSALPITLVGVAVDSERPGNSLSFIRCSSGPAEQAAAAAFKTGETACDVAEITEIREHTVVIRNLTAGRLELLSFKGGASVLAAQPPPDEPPPPVVVGQSRGLVTVDLRKALVDHYLANMDEVLSSALATPHRDSSGGGAGAIRGFELDQIKAGGAAERLGFRNGDVILAVNGVRLDGLDAVLRLMSQGPTPPQVRISALRGGQPMTFVFNTR